MSEDLGKGFFLTAPEVNLSKRWHTHPPPPTRAPCSRHWPGKLHPGCRFDNVFQALGPNADSKCQAQRECAGPHPNLGSTQVSKLLKLNERRRLQHPSASLAPPLAPGGQGCVKTWAHLQAAGVGSWHVACPSPALPSRTRNEPAAGKDQASTAGSLRQSQGLVTPSLACCSRDHAQGMEYAGQSQERGPGP